LLIILNGKAKATHLRDRSNKEQYCWNLDLLEAVVSNPPTLKYLAIFGPALTILDAGTLRDDWK
jgi:hypothetical protein